MIVGGLIFPGYRREQSVTSQLIVVPLPVIPTCTLLTDRDLNSLGSKALAERCALNHAGESLGRVDGEHVTEDGCEHWGDRFVGRQSTGSTGTGGRDRDANVYEGKAKSGVLCQWKI